MSRTDTPDLLKIAGGGSASDKRKVQTRSVGFSQDMDSAAGSTALGATAIASLLSRCKQVNLYNKFVQLYTCKGAYLWRALDRGPNWYKS